MVKATVAARAKALLRPCLNTPLLAMALVTRPILHPHPPTPPASTAPVLRTGTTAVMTTAFNVSFHSCLHRHGLIRPMTECVAQFGSPSTMYMPPAASMTASAGSYGNGATHTVWVAPTQGVLRYVPFAVNASVGDTVKFIWGANNHTVTKSAELDLCNKTGDQPFTSGTQNKTFVCKNHKYHFLGSLRN